MIVKNDGNFVLFNKIAASYFGGKPEDFVGKSMWDLFPKDNADSQMISIKGVIGSKRTSIKIEKTIINNQEKWFSRQNSTNN